MIQNNECQRSLHRCLVSDGAQAVIAIAQEHHSTGWKVNGAGGAGGSLTILANPDQDRKQLMLQDIRALGKGITPLNFSLSPSGLIVEIAM